MNTGQQTARQLASGAGTHLNCTKSRTSLTGTGRSVCRSCRNTRSRNYASVAASAVQSEDQVAQHIPPVAQTAPQTSYAVNAGVVLSRPPQITRDLHPFESAFYLYQRRLNERLALPFTRYFYYKKKTPADLEWKRKIRQRLTPARDIGRYKAYGAEAWNDELLMGAQESDRQWQVERLLEDAEQTGAEKQAEGSGAETTVPGGGKKVEHEPVERPMSRITEADLKHDVKSLDRLLQRTLYLLVKNKDGHWIFPQDTLTKETLHAVGGYYIHSRDNVTDSHQAAYRILNESAGVNMNTWIVGNVPIGHHQQEHVKAVKTASGLNELGLKTFFMKARIMAGQANLKGNKHGLTDFKWLAKEEIQKEVDHKYWHSIQNMLVDR